MSLDELRKRWSEQVDEAKALHAKAAGEDRAFTEEEQKRFDTLMDKADATEAEIEREQKIAELEGKLSTSQGTQAARRDGIGDGDNGGGSMPPGGADGWNSLGQFLQGVYRAAQPQFGAVDSRLLQVPAAEARATGLGESVPSEGGFLVPTDFVTALLERVHETGILIGRTRLIPLSTAANATKINALNESSRVDGSRLGGVQAFWEAEAGTKEATKPDFRQMELGLKKLIGLCYATDELLADAAQLQAIIMDAFAEEFGFKLDDAVINGTGAGIPLGILNSPALVTVAKEVGQANTTIVKENVDNMWARMWGRSKRNAVWLINTDCLPQLFAMNMAVGAGGAPVYLPPGGYSVAPYATIFGRPVLEIEQCQTLGTKGDIYLVDLSQWIRIEKGGMQTASSIHVRFVNDETVFRFVLRVDGQPAWNAALTPYKGTNTLSPYVTLAGRP